MQDPKFEKRVQRMMVELKFSPSPEVWDRVEAEINRDQKKKRFVIWWIFCGLLLFIGIFYIGNRATSPYFSGLTEQKNKLNSVARNTPSKPQMASEKSEVLSVVSLAHGLRPEPSIKNLGVVELAKTLTPPNRKMKPTIGMNANSHQFNRRNGNRSVISQMEKVINKDTERPISFSTEKPNGNDSLLNGKQAGFLPNFESVDSIEKKNAKNYASKVPPLKFIGTDSLKGQAQKKRKSSVRLHVSPGFLVSGNLTALYSYSKNRLAQAVSPSTIYSNVGPYSSSNAPSFRSTNGFSLASGIFIGNSFSDRLAISIGLNYHYYSTQIETGKWVDTILPIYNLNTQVSLTNGYFISGMTQSYTNRFHFLEFPLLMEMKLLRIRKNSLVAEGGFITSYLIQTNALYYDPYANIYYINKKVFQHWGVNGNVAFLYKFRFRKQDFQMGPQCQFGITGLLNHTTNYQEKLGSAGIIFTMNPFRK